MVTNSSILAWEIPRKNEPGGLQSMGSQKTYIFSKFKRHQVMDKNMLLTPSVQSQRASLEEQTLFHSRVDLDSLIWL